MSDTGWHTVRWAAAAFAALGVVDAASTVLGAAPAERPGTGLLMAGLVAFNGLAAYGTWQRARWGLWLGGVLSVLIPALVLLSQVPGLRDPQVTITAGAVALAACQALAYGAYLVGLALLRRAG